MTNPSPPAGDAATGKVHFYETPDGVAARSDEGTVYVNIVPARSDRRLAIIRVNKRLANGKKFVVHVELDAEMMKILAKRADAVADLLEV